MKTLIENTPAKSTLIYVGEITDDVQIIVDAGSKMFECWVDLYELESEYYQDDPVFVPFNMRRNHPWKLDPSFLKTMVLNNIEIVEELSE